MNTKWYIEKDFFWEGQPDTILSALTNLETPYAFHKEHRYDSEYIYPYDQNDCVLVYGSIEFARRVHRETKWIPGASWVDIKNLLCSTYYSHYGDYLLNREYCFTTLAEFKRRKDYMFEMFGVDNEVFIRPDSPYKEFTGFVVKKEDFDKRIVTMSYGELDPTLMMIVAKPQNIYGEDRFYICKNEVITGCQYKINGEHAERSGYSGNALRLAQEISKLDWMPSPLFVVDIGLVNGKNGEEAKLLEINSFNSSGMYLCNLEKLALKANEIALKSWQEVNE